MNAPDGLDAPDPYVYSTSPTPCSIAVLNFRLGLPGYEITLSSSGMFTCHDNL